MVHSDSAWYYFSWCLAGYPGKARGLFIQMEFNIYGLEKMLRETPRKEQIGGIEKDRAFATLISTYFKGYWVVN